MRACSSILPRMFLSFAMLANAQMETRLSTEYAQRAHNRFGALPL